MRRSLMAQGLAICLLATVATGRAPLLAGAAWEEYTSTRCVAALHVTPGGTVWAATTGGVLRRDESGAWTKHARAQGLPDVQARRVTGRGERVVVELARGRVAWTGDAWQPCSDGALPRAEIEGAVVEAELSWQGSRYAITRGGASAWQEQDGRWAPLGLPPGRGSHATGLVATPRGLVLSLYGGGLWKGDGRSWEPVFTPPEARGVTALAAHGDDVWVGTRDQGIFRWRTREATWEHFEQPGEPYSHNVQALAELEGTVFVSTLDEGLLAWRGGAFTRVAGLSSPCPRDLVVFGGRLYVRHGSGQVDCFDGTSWTKDAIRGSLPRKEASTLAVGEGRLWVGQWGGYSAFDGRAWEHVLRVPDLQGLSVTCLLPERERVWVGTQQRGLACLRPDTGGVAWHDERAGLPDDWVTALRRHGGSLWAGTFVGGVARWRGSRWVVEEPLRGEQVTALGEGQGRALLIGTRHGLWTWQEDGLVRGAFGVPRMDGEVQALLRDSREWTWIGTRTGLWRGMLGGP